MVDLTEIGDEELRAEQYRRNREHLGYPYALLVTDEDKLKWVKLRRDRLQRETERWDAHQQERHERNEEVSPFVYRNFQDTLLSMANYMLEDLNFLLEQNQQTAALRSLLAIIMTAEGYDLLSSSETGLTAILRDGALVLVPSETVGRHE